MFTTTTIAVGAFLAGIYAGHLVSADDRKKLRELEAENATLKRKLE